MRNKSGDVQSKTPPARRGGLSISKDAEPLNKCERTVVSFTTTAPAFVVFPVVEVVVVVVLLLAEA